MKPDITVKHNEAWVDSSKVTAYYGPMNIDENTQEWLCVIKKNGKQVFSASNSQLLDVACGESPESMLLAGIALYLSR